MFVVQIWTGKDARALRIALRVSVRDFAEDLGTSPRTISKWESGDGSRRPRPEFQAVLDTVLRQADDDQRLRFFQARSATQPAVTEEPAASSLRSAWWDVVVHMAEGWSSDVLRREFLRSATYTASAATVPALQWFVGSPERIARPDGDVQVTQADIGTIREFTETFRSLDNQFGGGHARGTVVRFLAADVGPLLREGAFGNDIGSDLLDATAELLHLAAWMTYDSGDHPLAQRYLSQALRLAQSTGNQALAAEIMAGLSHQASFLGDAGTAVDLARAAARVATSTGLTALSVEAALMEAHGHACWGDEQAVTRAIVSAEAAMSAVGENHDEPRWMAYFGEAYMSAKLAHCYKELRMPETATRHARLALNMQSGYARGRAFNTALLAQVRAQAGDVDEACAVGTEAVGLVAELHSERALGYIRALVVELDGLPSKQSREFRSLVGDVLPQAVQHGQ